MKLAVAGGTGVVGRFVVAKAREQGHDIVVMVRTKGVDLSTGDGLHDALVGVDAVIDVSNVSTLSAKKSIAFFERASRLLVTAEHEVGVGHHVALSIVGIDRVESGYYRGKLAQEREIAEGLVPWTVLRATQFHEFPSQVLRRVSGPVVPVPRMRTATVAASEVADRLVQLAVGAPTGMATELAGPEDHDLPDLVRSESKRHGRRRVIVPVTQPGETGRLLADGGLLPAGDCVRGVQTFAQWQASAI